MKGGIRTDCRRLYCCGTPHAFFEQLENADSRRKQARRYANAATVEPRLGPSSFRDRALRERTGLVCRRLVAHHTNNSSH